MVYPWMSAGTMVFPWMSAGTMAGISVMAPVSGQDYSYDPNLHLLYIPHQLTFTQGRDQHPRRGNSLGRFRERAQAQSVSKTYSLYKAIQVNNSANSCARFNPTLLTSSLHQPYRSVSLPVHHPDRYG